MSLQMASKPPTNSPPLIPHLLQPATGVLVESRFTILSSHGNASALGHTRHNKGPLTQALGRNLLVYEYRGYGLADGQPQPSRTTLPAPCSVTRAPHRSAVTLSTVLLQPALAARFCQDIHNIQLTHIDMAILAN